MTRQIGRMRLLLLFGTLVTVVSLTVCGSAWALSKGQLDTSFGSNGFGSAGSDTHLLGTAVQPDGKIVAVGAIGFSANNVRLLVVRFTAGGSMDSSFAGGKVIGLPGVIGRAVAIQRDGKIVVAGEATDATGASMSGIVIERLTSSGTPDGSFGSGGIARALTGDQAASGNAVAVQPDGKIVVGGSGTIASGVDQGYQGAALVRLNSNGSLDGSFASGGVEVADLGRYSVANGVAIQPDGKIDIGGSFRDPGLLTTVLMAARFSPNGSSDGSFGSGGEFFRQYAGSGGAYSEANGVALQPDGKLVLAGSALSGTGINAVFVRLTSAGAPDNGFGSGGVEQLPDSDTAASPPTGSQYVPYGAGGLVVSGGEIFATGWFWHQNHVKQLAVWGLTSSGAPDGGFGTGGRTLIGGPSPNAGVQGSAIAVEPDGNLAAAGEFVAAPFSGADSGFVAVFGGASIAPPPPPPPPPPPSTSRIGLMGRMGFVSPGGVIGVQVGCFHGTTACTGHIQMSHNGAVVGQTNFRIAPESGGFQNLKLSSVGSRLLRQNRPFHLLPAQVTVTGNNGQRISEVMHLARWVWGNGSGRAHTTLAPLSPLPPRPSTSRIGLMGNLGFVSPGRVIGVEVGCFNGATTCAGQIKMTHNGILVGQRAFRIAPESGGFQNLTLSSEGNRLLNENRRFRLLAVNVTVTGTNGQRISEVMHLARWIWR